LGKGETGIRERRRREKGGLSQKKKRERPVSRFMLETKKKAWK